MRILLLSFLSVLFLNSSYAQYQNKTILGEVDNVNYGHFSISSDEAIGHYVLGGTQYSRPLSLNNSKISLMELDQNLNLIQSQLITSSDLSHLRCYKLIKATNGHPGYLLVGTALRASNLYVGVVIHVDNNLNIINHTIIETGDGEESIIALDATFTDDNIIVGGVTLETSFPNPNDPNLLQDLDLTTNKQGFYALLNHNLDHQIYFKTYNQGPITTNGWDFDIVHRVKYLPSLNSFLIMGSKSEGYAMLALVDELTGAINWEFNESLSSYELLADALYFPGSDQLVIAINSWDPTHSFELLSISQFSTPTKISSAIHARSFAGTWDNLWANQIIPSSPHSTNGSDFIISVYLSDQNEDCPSPQHPSLGQNVKAGYVSYTLSNLMPVGDIVFKEAPVYEYNTALGYFSNMWGDKPPLAYTNSLTFGLGQVNEEYTQVHYRTDNDALELEVSEIGLDHHSTCLGYETEFQYLQNSTSRIPITASDFSVSLLEVELNITHNNPSMTTLCNAVRKNNCSDVGFRKKEGKSNSINENVALTLSPNPVQNIITLSENIDRSTLQIHDLSGREVEYKILNNHQINVDNLPSGVFLIRYKQNNKFYTHKFIKQ